MTKSFPFYFHQIFLNPHLRTKEHKSLSSKYILSSSFQVKNKNTHRNLASNLSWDFFDLCKTPLLIMKMCFQGIYWSLYLQCYIFVLPQRKVRIRRMKLFWCRFLVMDKALVPRLFLSDKSLTIFQRILCQIIVPACIHPHVPLCARHILCGSPSPARYVQHMWKYLRPGSLVSMSPYLHGVWHYCTLG